jgi:pyruvate formate lyase activating enzyme
MKEPGPTPVAVLERIYKQARDIGLHYPYLGNVFQHRFESTYCPVCGALLIERQGFSSVFRNLSEKKCTQCGEAIPYVDKKG